MLNTIPLTKKYFTKEFLQSDFTLLLGLATIKFLVMFFIHPDFGLHRDEFLYWAMADHLDWGYLEVPPLIAFFANIASSLFGDTIFAVRFFPALTGAITLVLSGLIAKELGGKRFAQLLTAISYLVSLLYLRVNILFQPVAFDVMYFVLCTYLLIKILKTNRPLYWILLGIFMGLGLLNKYTMLLFGFGTAIGLLLTPYRRFYLNKWLWISSLIAILILLPNIIWQYNQGWPVIEHMSALSSNQLDNVNPLIFILTQLLMNMYSAPLWLAGLVFFLFLGKGKIYRPLGWIYLSILTVLLLFSGKAYYQAATYPMLFAGGAVMLESLIRKSKRKGLKTGIVSFIIVGSLTTVPIGIPVFSINGMISFFEFGSKYMGMSEALRWETGEFHPLPQDFADMLGWEEMVQQVAAHYHRMPTQEKAPYAVFASNYGEAGAIDFYGEKYNLPKVISKGSSYWLWGTRDYSADFVLSIGMDEESMEFFYGEVLELDPFSFDHAREDGIPILLVRKPKMSAQKMWDVLKAHRY
jgi:hypothetical protein